LANHNIKGIKVGEEEVNITLDTNDTMLFLRDLKSVHSLLEELDLFKNCSGFELNKAKTEATWLGSWADRSVTPFGLRWPNDSIHALGIHFSSDQAVSDKLDFESKLNELQNILNSWKRRKLTLLGKVNITKFLGLSLFLMLPSCLYRTCLIKKLDAITFDFLWEGSPTK